MRDIQIQKQIYESKSPLEKLDEEFVQKTTEIESENYLKAKEVATKLERTILVQKKTTDELKMQGEKIHKIKEDSVKIFENAMAASEVTHKIHQESSLFPGLGTLFRGIKKWWKKDRKMLRDVEDIKIRSPGMVSACEIQESEFDPLREEHIPGENKTDEMLNRILNSVRKVRTEAQTQLEIVKAQDCEISDVDRLGEFSKKVVDQTEKDVRRK